MQLISAARAAQCKTETRMAGVQVSLVDRISAARAAQCKTETQILHLSLGPPCQFLTRARLWAKVVSSAESLDVAVAVPAVTKQVLTPSNNHEPLSVHLSHSA